MFVFIDFAGFRSSNVGLASWRHYQRRFPYQKFLVQGIIHYSTTSCPPFGRLSRNFHACSGREAFFFTHSRSRDTSLFTAPWTLNRFMFWLFLALNSHVARTSTISWSRSVESCERLSFVRITDEALMWKVNGVSRCSDSRRRWWLVAVSWETFNYLAMVVGLILGTLFTIYFVCL